MEPSAACVTRAGGKSKRKSSRALSAWHVPPCPYEIFHNNNLSLALPPTVYVTREVTSSLLWLPRLQNERWDQTPFVPSLIPAFGHSTNTC